MWQPATRIHTTTKDRKFRQLYLEPPIFFFFLDPDFLSELISLNQSMREGSHTTKNDLREMSKVVDQLIGKTDFTDPDSVGEMVTEALTNLESEVWPNTMEFAKGIR